MWSSVVPALPWIVRVEFPLMAAASSSLRSDFAVPGSPTSMSPRPVASATIARSTSDGLPTNFWRTFFFSSPRTKLRTARADIFQPGGFGASSCLRRRVSSSA